MWKKLLTLLMTLIISVASFALNANAQDTNSQNLTVEDAKQLRKIVAENESLKAECDELRRQCEGWKTSAKNWQDLYEKEKFRADEILTRANNDYQEALKTQKFALNLQRDQLQSDREYITSLEGKVKSLRKSKWTFGGITFITGFGTGAYLGNQLPRLNI